MAYDLLCEYQRREQEAFEEYVNFQDYQQYLKGNYRKKLNKILDHSNSTINSQNSMLQDQVDGLNRQLESMRGIQQRIQKENEQLIKQSVGKNVKGVPEKRFQDIIQKLVNDNKQIKDQRLQIHEILGDKERLRVIESQKRDLIAENIKLKTVMAEWEHKFTNDSKSAMSSIYSERRISPDKIETQELSREFGDIVKE